MYLIGIRYYNEMALFCLPKQSEYNINQEIKQVLKKKIIQAIHKTISEMVDPE
jgi:hypothetical protein